MAVVKGELFFAPGIRMRDLNLDDPAGTLDAFERRVHGLFLSPIHVMETSAESEEGGLFACALLVAALIESLARVETGSDAQGTLIKQWLEAHIPAFRELISIKGKQLTLADVFEYRFRNGLAHNGYVASLGRLSRAIDGPIRVSDDVVTVNPFALAAVVIEQFENFANDLRAGRRDIRRFQYQVKQQFDEEVARARSEPAA